MKQPSPSGAEVRTSGVARKRPRPEAAAPGRVRALEPELKSDDAAGRQQAGSSYDHSIWVDSQNSVCDLCESQPDPGNESDEVVCTGWRNNGEGSVLVVD